MHELKPGDVDAMYNMARMYCLLGHKDKVYEWLAKAIEAGFDDADGLANDKDFNAIHAEQRFRALVKQLRQAGQKGATQK